MHADNTQHSVRAVERVAREVLQKARRVVTHEAVGEGKALERQAPETTQASAVMSCPVDASTCDTRCLLAGDARLGLIKADQGRLILWTTDAVSIQRRLASLAQELILWVCLAEADPPI